MFRKLEVIRLPEWKMKLDPGGLAASVEEDERSGRRFGRGARLPTITTAQTRREGRGGGLGDWIGMRARERERVTGTGALVWSTR